jgi:hypothetical protein
MFVKCFLCQGIYAESRFRSVRQHVRAPGLSGGSFLRKAPQPVGKGSVNEIVIFSVGSRSAVSIRCEENFIPARNLPLDGTKPGSSLLSMEGVLGRSPSGEAFWPAGIAGGQPASGAQIGFWVFWPFSARRPGAPPGRIWTAPPSAGDSNPKIEIRSPKQIPSTNKGMTKTTLRRLVLDIGRLGI